jgi:Cu(I)/Ag(I) efflux system membrane fusion protein/cobalt-zinc-cadmium efflux system membrane fusion protein
MALAGMLLAVACGPKAGTEGVALAPSVAPIPAAQRALYTCGMHPEIIADEPGDCPKCQMKLTPMEKDRARMVLEARGETVSDADSGAPAGERKILYWRAPMDPTYIRQEPGKSPMGMDLLPVYEDEVAGGPTIRIDPVTEQNMAVRYAPVRVGPLDKEIRTVGTIAYDERGLGTVTTKIDGWIEKLLVNETGTQVHAGDPLFEFYSPQLYSAQEEYLVALRDARRAGEGEAGDLAQSRVRSAGDRLRLYDIGEAQIDALAQSGKINKTMTIAAAMTGIVTERSVTEGEFLKAGTPAYRIADLSNVWVVGKVYESDLAWVRTGQEARMTLDYLPGRTHLGRVTYVYPYLEEGTREIPVRMEFHNPGYLLKPGMYATIRLRSRIKDEAVLAPSSAVIDTGERQVAFVRREGGKFEPRQLTLGPRGDDGTIEILKGLVPGESVVVSGQFLLDSESRLREATLKMLNPGKIGAEQWGADEPGQGAEARDGARGRPLRHVCPMPEHAGVVYDEPGGCPLCGMKMVPVGEDYEARNGKVAHYTCPMPEHGMVEEPAPGKCPLCGMTLVPVIEREIRQKTGAAQGAPTLYTCPMASHADVVSDAPGRCEKCGMTLTPTSGVAHGAQSEAAWNAAHGAEGGGHDPAHH